MLSLRCRINANVAELLVIIGYSAALGTYARSSSVRFPPFAPAACLPCLPACLLACLSACPFHPLSPFPPPPPSIPRNILATPRLSVRSRFASSPVWSFPRLPRCRESHWRASRWTRSNSNSSNIHEVGLAIRTIRDRD